MAPSCQTWRGAASSGPTLVYSGFWSYICALGLLEASHSSGTGRYWPLPYLSSSGGLACNSQGVLQARQTRIQTNKTPMDSLGTE